MSRALESLRRRLGRKNRNISLDRKKMAKKDIIRNIEQYTPSPLEKNPVVNDKSNPVLV